MADVDRLMRQAVADSIFPGGVIRVSRENRVLFCRAYGYANRVTRRAMTTATLFDLASLTKPLATTLAVMLLHQRGAIDVAASLESVLPAFAGSDKAGVTIAQLLSHTSGLPAYGIRSHEGFWRFLAVRHSSFLDEWMVNVITSGENRNTMEALAKVLLDECTGFMLSRNKGYILRPEEIENYLEDKFKTPLGELDKDEKEKLLNLEKHLHDTYLVFDEGKNHFGTPLEKTPQDAVSRVPNL